MANELKDTIKDCIHNIDVLRRFIRPEEAEMYLPDFVKLWAIG